VGKVLPYIVIPNIRWDWIKE